VSTMMGVSEESKRTFPSFLSHTADGGTSTEKAENSRESGHVLRRGPSSVRFKARNAQVAREAVSMADEGCGEGTNVVRIFVAEDAATHCTRL